jgi:hypothetical protein
MASFRVLPHNRPAELSALTAPAPWTSLLGNGLLNGALNHRSRQDGEDNSNNENQGHNLATRRLATTKKPVRPNGPVGTSHG